MVRVLIIGAGGHAQIVADILLQALKEGSSYKPVGFLDDDATLLEKNFLNLPVLGKIAQLNQIDHDSVIIAIGDNRDRAYLFDSILAENEKIINAIHPSALIASDVRFGQGVMICAGVVINTGTVIGDNVILNSGCTIDHHNQIGSHAHIAPGVHLGGNVTIGEGTLVGIGACVIPGCTIGEWSVPVQSSRKIFQQILLLLVFQLKSLK